MLNPIRRWLGHTISTVRVSLERAEYIRRNSVLSKAIRLVQSEGLVVMQSSDINRKDRMRNEIGHPPDRDKLVRLVLDLATGIWRTQQRINSALGVEVDGERRAIMRHLSSCVDALTSAEIEVRDPTGEPYVAGMALKVIAFQPMNNVKHEFVAEVIKPSIYHQGHLAQVGEVIVGTPQTNAGEEPIREDSSTGESSSPPANCSDPEGHETTVGEIGADTLGGCNSECQKEV